MPHTLIEAAPWVRGVFDHTWAPMKALALQIERLPPALWNHLLNFDRGYVLIGPSDSQYLPGPTIWRTKVLHNVAFVSVEDLAAENERTLHVIGHLIDHHLGCAGRLGDPWLSEGGGVMAGWHVAAARFPSLFSLGYAVDPVAQANVREYFAQSLALCCRDRQRLTAADPQVAKWFRNSLWNPKFWQG